MISPAQLEAFILALFEPEWEPGFEAYREHLRTLNDIAESHGEPVEGSLFNAHLQSPLPTRPVEQLLGKRRNYALFCQAGESLLEIGFNAGHSALLALTINTSLSYTGVDIGVHAYTQPCFEFLKSLFGDRIQLLIGDSREVLPSIAAEGRRFDLYHIDGGHGFRIAHADLCTVLTMARQGGTLLFDDTDDARLDALCDFYVLKGDMTRIRMDRLKSETPGLWHDLFRLHPRRRD